MMLLEIRSPALEAMFMQESKTLTVDLKGFCDFLATDQLNADKNTAIGLYSLADKNTAIGLYSLANKYDIQGLKKKARVFLLNIEDFDREVFEILYQAEEEMVKKSIF